MKLLIQQNAIGVLGEVFIQDSSSMVGAGLGSLVFNTAGLTGYYHRQGDATSTAISLATMTLGTWATGGFVVTDGTNMKGTYQLGFPNAMFTALGDVVCYLQGAANMAPLVLEFQVVAFNPNSATSFITGINGLAPPSNWNVMAIDGSGRVDVGKTLGQAVTLDANNVLNVSTKYVGGTLQTAGDIPAKTNSLAFTVANQVDANPLSWKSGTIPATNIPGVPLIDLKYTLGTISPATAGSVRADQVTGAVGSVTGAVGSVTAAVTVGGYSAGQDCAVRRGTAQAGGASTITLDSGASATDHIYERSEVAILSGTGAGQANRVITGYVGATKVATVTPAWTTNPDSSSVFAILPAGADVETIKGTASTGQAGSMGIDWGQVANPTTTLDLSGTTIKNVDNAIATVTNLTNAPTNGDFTATMKTSLNAATPASITGSVAGDVQGKVLGGGASALVGVAAQVDLEQIGADAGGITGLNRSAKAIGYGTVGTGSTTTSIVTSAITPPVTTASGQFNGRVLIFDKSTTTANLRGQAATISAATTGGVLTVSALTDAPVASDSFTIT